MMHRIRTQQLAIKSGALRAMRVPKFLRNLYEMLHHEDQAILAWSKDGSYFQIFDTRRLEMTVLPKYFKHGKFASFQRQLNNFGFRKWTKTQSSVCTFSHHHLVRYHPQQLADFISQRSPLSSVRSVADLSSTTGRKRTLTELVQSTDAAIPALAKTMKRGNSSYRGLPQPVDAKTRSTLAPLKCARSATDPIGFILANGMSDVTFTKASVEQVVNCSVEKQYDHLPIAGRQENLPLEKLLEMRMLNDCFDFGTEANLYTASIPLSGILWSSLPSTWQCDTIFSQPGRMHVEERSLWNLL
ncbi:hypothetical protein PsorP6_016115 [Peronosclerospora sorghi]|uniref:Uncharacterized protein n=1 Tax=Peronosclerospora sorghi TaxID=230839 RepID=A0ACC0VN89_9STRA|nr:hypothetical protein PsorP6_016115 [Peronosclerospora sorghi]